MNPPVSFEEYLEQHESFTYSNVDARPGDDVMLDDNCITRKITREYGVRDADILGVMTGFIPGREGTRHPGTGVSAEFVLGAAYHRTTGDREEMQNQAARLLKRGKSNSIINKGGRGDELFYPEKRRKALL